MRLREAHGCGIPHYPMTNTVLGLGGVGGLDELAKLLKESAH